MFIELTLPNRVITWYVAPWLTSIIASLLGFTITSIVWYFYFFFQYEKKN